VVRASKCHLPIVCTSNPSPDHTYSLTNDQLDGSSESSVGDDECNLSDVDEDFDDDDLDDDDDEDDVNKVGSDDEEIDEEVDDEEGFDEEVMQCLTVPPDDDKNIFDFGKFVVQRRSCPASDRLKICDTKSKGVLTRGMVSRLVAEQKTSVTKQRSRKGGGEADSHDDETQKTFEGADALLNLASIGLLSLFQSAVSAAEDDSHQSDTLVSTPPSSPAADISSEDVSGNNNNNNNNNSVELKPVKQESPDDGESVDTSPAVVKEEPMDDS